MIEHKTFSVWEIYVSTRAHTLTVSLYFEPFVSGLLLFFFSRCFFSDLFVWRTRTFFFSTQQFSFTKQKSIETNFSPRLQKQLIDEIDRWLTRTEKIKIKIYINDVSELFYSIVNIFSRRHKFSAANWSTLKFWNDRYQLERSENISASILWKQQRHWNMQRWQHQPSVNRQTHLAPLCNKPLIPLLNCMNPILNGGKIH